VRQARDMVRGQQLGPLRKLVEYNQSWLMNPIERLGSKRAAWRTDSGRAGVSGCVGDIGSHAENLLQFVTGQRICVLCADLCAFLPGGEPDDDANTLIRLEGGGKGTFGRLWCG
jgi:predicted dehydrogenase